MGNGVYATFLDFRNNGYDAAFCFVPVPVGGNSVCAYSAGLIYNDILVLCCFVDIENVKAFEDGAFFYLIYGVCFPVLVSYVYCFGHLSVGGVEKRGVTGNASYGN